MAVPKFSLVIAACDRPHLLEPTMKSCLGSEFKDFELVVSDNFSGPEVGKVVRSFMGDKRVRYVRTDHRLSCTDHWEFAWKHAKAPYIHTLGDDDGLIPRALTVINQVIEKWDPQLVSWYGGLYFHPGWQLDFGGNVYRFCNDCTESVFRINIEKMIENYGNFDRTFFPEGTRMCFRKDLAESILRTTGRFFWRFALDLTAPLLLLGTIEKGSYLYIDSCLAFGGRSVDSNVAAYEKPQKGVDHTKRAREFFDEHGDEDICLYHPYKSRAYYNAHPQALNLAKVLYPEQFKKYSVSQSMFLYKIKAEMLGLSVCNPFLDDGDIQRLEEYALTLPPVVSQVVDSALLESLLTTPISYQETLEKLINMEKIRETVWKGKDADKKIDLKSEFIRKYEEKLRSGTLPPIPAAPAEIMKSNPDAHAYLLGNQFYAICSKLGCQNSYDFSKIHDKILGSIQKVERTPQGFMAGLVDETLKI